MEFDCVSGIIVKMANIFVQLWKWQWDGERIIFICVLKEWVIALSTEDYDAFFFCRYFSLFSLIGLYLLLFHSFHDFISCSPITTRFNGREKGPVSHFSSSSSCLVKDNGTHIWKMELFFFLCQPGKWVLYKSISCSQRNSNVNIWSETILLNQMY